MSENKLIIAAAGSGKTRHLVNEALGKEGSVLILTYTLSNEDVIKRRLIKHAACIPRNVTVQTWFSFLLQHGVRPYQGSLHNSLFEKDIKGMLLVNQQSAFRFQGRTGPVYWGEADLDKHYFSKEHKIYSDKIAKFSVKCCARSNGAVIERIERIYDHILIDEVQDLAGYDLELLKLLFMSKVAVLLVGDPRQVTYLTHIERKYSKYRNGMIRDFVCNELGKNIRCSIDEVTLGASHRCNQSICKYSSLLYPDLPETTPCSCCTNTDIEHQGLFLIKPSQVDEYVRTYNPVQLRWDRKVNVHSDYKVMNFGEAKGETSDRVLIYPTKDMIEWVSDNSVKLSDSARAKFYVALTRARFSAAIVMEYDDNFEPDCLIKYSPKNAV